ncbi:MAG: DUF434 domain-containing protein [Planctomycetota bacterium]|jgi:hypothetical protein
MPDKRSHRGPHPQDTRLFAADTIENLRAALADFSMLLTKGYADKSALKLVGDKFSLTQRQRLAIMRSACSDQQLDLRKQRQVKVTDLADKPLVIDGYNVLITVEAAMSGAVVFRGRDGCCRDLASIHGTYRKVTETIPAIELIGEFLKDKSVSESLWLLDSPVSNSGRLKKLIGELAQKKGWKLDVELLPSPDAELIKTDNVVVSSDSVVLNRCKKWVNLARAIIEEKLPDTWLLDLS